MEEIFKDIPGYEGIYQVSNLGRIRKITYLTPYSGDGYMRVRLCKNKDDHKMKLVHRLVAEAFLDNPKNLPEINHKDENRTNNRVDNLEYCTHEYNINYGNHNEKVLDALTKKGVINKPIYQYDLNGNLIKKHECVKKIEGNFKKNSIYKCAAKEKGDIYEGFIWSYKELNNINLECYYKKTAPKKILQYNLSKELVNTWDSANKASKYGYNPSAIIQCCKGKAKTHKGYIWKYKNNV